MVGLFNTLSKYGQLAAFILGLILIVGYLLGVFGGLEDFNLLEKKDRGTTGIFSFGLGAACFLIIIAFALMLIFGLVQGIASIGKSKTGLIGLVILLVIAGGAYATATTDGMAPSLAKKLVTFDVSNGEYKFISAAITTAVALTAIAFLSFMLSEVRNIFK